MSQRQELPTMLFSLSHLLCLDLSPFCLKCFIALRMSTRSSTRLHFCLATNYCDHMLQLKSVFKQYLIFSPFFVLFCLFASHLPPNPPQLRFLCFSNPRVVLGIFLSNRHPMDTCKPPSLFSRLIEFAADF